MAVNFRKAPFSLTDEQIAWVERTYESLSFDEKIGQLICCSLGQFDAETMERVTGLHIGSLMIRPFPVAGLQENMRRLQDMSRLPMLVSGNLENGGAGVLMGGTLFNQPMGCTATGNMENGYRLGKISAAEATSVGVNWGFAPIVDLDLNYRNPITNIRAFSSKKEEVLEMARGYLKAAKEEGLTATIKHFPGDGSDERDQHLLVSVNELGYEEWMGSYGWIYQTLIDEGAPTVMAGHIAQPAVARAIEPGISDRDAFMPASQSKTLLTGMLRERLGFNGLIVTDSTLMVGYMAKLPRRDGLCASIEAGADMILFNRNMEEDVAFLKDGVRDGKISQERFRDAVLRVLALKASMDLHRKKAEGRIVPGPDALKVIGCEQFKAWTKECADEAPTLVKDKGILPLSPEQTKRVYLNVIQNEVNDQSPFAQKMVKRLEAEGFEVTLRRREMKINMEEMIQGIMTPDSMRVMAEIMATTESFTSQYDLAMIVLDMPTESNATVVRVKWSVFAGLGNDIPWYAGEMPLVVVSFANPYHLLDIPMADVYINAYTDNEETQEAVFDKLMGRSDFVGVSPVDPFCGHEDCRI